MTDLVWNVVYHDINTDKIKVYNIFKHGSFMEDLQKHYKKHKTKEAFAEALRRSLMYYFWSKCEWEVLISPWCGSKKNEAIKVDVYWQVMNNWDHFLDYVWNAKRRKTPKSPNYIDINSIANIPDAVIDELVLACVRSGNASEEYISRLEQAIVELRKKGQKMNSQIDAHESCLNGKLDFLSMPTVSEDELPDRLDEILSAIDNGSGPYLILCNNGSNLLLFGWEDYWHRFGVLYRDGEKEQIEAACRAAEKE